MYANELLKRQPDAASALTNEFLPGQGLDPGLPRLPEQPRAGAEEEVGAGQALPLAVALEEAAHLGLVGACLRVPVVRRPTSLR